MADESKAAEIINTASQESLANGLAEAFGFNPWGLPQGPGGSTEQVSDVATIFKNLRWYLISNMRQPLSQAYAEIGVIQTVCDVPVDDALRGGLEIKSDQLDPDDIDELHAAMEDAGDLEVLAEAARWNRLFGGSGVVAFTDQNPSKPLTDIRQGEDLEFRAADLWELLFDLVQGAEIDQTFQVQDVDYFRYYGKNLHKSRAFTMKGVTAPSFLRPRLRGWGLSVVEILVRSVNQYLKSSGLTFEVLDEFKVDVYKLKNLAAAVMQNKQDQVLKRIQLANMQKNYQHAVVIDGEEEWDHKQLSFAGLAEAQAGIRMQVASDLRMPMIKLFGQQAGGGLGSTGEDEIEVYNSMVEGCVRFRMRRPARQMVKLRCQQLFGHAPDDLKVAFKPLRVLSQEQEENVKTQKFTRLHTAATTGLISAEEFRDAANRGGLFDIELDPNAAPSPEDVPGADDEEGGDDEKRNSLAFDRAAYAADGGDGWINPGRLPFFDRDKAKDKGLWDRVAAEAGDNKAFAIWLYDKHGGKW